jgi:hypothetical protein
VSVLDRLRKLGLLVQFRTQGQSNEHEILRELVDRRDLPRTFVEFGFGPVEFNTGDLIRSGFTGILIDGAGGAARRFLRWRLAPRRVEVIQRFLTAENVAFLRERFQPRQLGVLSIDVDGNDYWILKALLPMEPAIIVVEYNASFGPERRVTVPYDPSFDRHAKHPSGMYHGASLAALAALCTDYALVGVSDAGANAFFVRSDFECEPIDPAVAWRESKLRNELNASTAAEQWEAIRTLPLVEV